MAETDLDLLGDEGDESSDDSDPEGESDGGADPKSSDKRVRDLQSAKDKETARANKAEASLARLQAAMKEPDAEGGKPPAAGGSGGDAADSAVIEMARMLVYQQQPKLAEYGIPASDLSGGTVTEIAQAAAAVVSRLEKFETQARNKVLAEQGLAPEVDGGAPPEPARDFSKMSDEDFKKVMDAALRSA